MPEHKECEHAVIEQLRSVLTPGGSCLVDTQLRQGGEGGLDSTTMRRWLVARKWDVAAAARQLSAHAEYRAGISGGRITEVNIVICSSVKTTPELSVDPQPANL